MDDSKIKAIEYANAVSEKTHPLPNEDSRFFDKIKSALPLSNPGVTYRKHSKKLLSN